MIKTIEEMSLNALPALENMVYDGWLMKFSKGYTRRANSIYPLYESSCDINKKIRKCEEIYNSKGLNVIYKVTSEAYPDNLDSILEKHGYKVDAPTSVQVLDLDNITEPENENLIVSTAVNEEWLDYFCRIDNVSDEKKEILETILKSIIPEKYFILMQKDGKVIGTGLGVLEDDFVGVYNIAIDKDYRNKGFGKELVLSLLKIGKEHGAKRSYLQVTLNNASALKLYSNIGFNEEYKYWYRIKEKINYNETCKIYDLVREADMVTINRIIEEGKIDCNSRVLEIGCGTGNYAVAISSITKAQVYGMDQSYGMLEKASSKGSVVNFTEGDAVTLEGFEDNYFDVIYMVDVIHHIKDINSIFKNIYRVLKSIGMVCIFTDSYENIKKRLSTKYFPETLEIELKRYQSTEEIFEAMKSNGFINIKADNLDIGCDEEAGEKLIKIAEKKGYSMFNLISQKAIDRGIERLKEDLKRGKVKNQGKASYVSACKQ